MEVSYVDLTEAKTYQSYFNVFSEIMKGKVLPGVQMITENLIKATEKWIEEHDSGNDTGDSSGVGVPPELRSSCCVDGKCSVESHSCECKQERE